MDRDALAARDEADDRVRRRRLAAARESGQQTIDADDENPVAAVGSAAASHDEFRLGGSGRRKRLRERRDRGLHLAAVDLVAREWREEIVGAREPRLRRDR